MFSYYAYGLGIHSEIKIPEFVTDADSVKSYVKINIKPDAELTEYLSEEALEYPWALNLTREKAIVYIRPLARISKK